MRKNNKTNNICKLKLNSSCRTLAITCFEEHLPEGEEKLFKTIRSIKSTEYEIIAIKHYKGTNKDHYHIILRIPDSSNTKRVNFLLKKLGIVFRPGVDDTFIKNRALETCGYYPNYVTYLLHQTTEAIQEGKTPYESKDFITNLNSSEIALVLNGHVPTKRKLTKKALANIIDQSRTAGYELKNYDSFIESFNILGFTTTEENKIKKAYNAGVSERMTKDGTINRLTLEIEYPENVTSAMKKRIDDALRISMTDHNCCCTNRIPLTIDPTTEAIIILSDFIEKTFSYIDLSNRRIMLLNRPFTNSEKIWRGSYFIFTHAYISRKDPVVQLFTNKIDYAIHKDYKLNKDSLLCTVENDMLKCIREPDCEFSEEEYIFMINEFKRIRDKFNDAMKETIQFPNTRKLSLDDLNS